MLAYGLTTVGVERSNLACDGVVLTPQQQVAFEVKKELSLPERAAVSSARKANCAMRSEPPSHLVRTKHRSEATQCVIAKLAPRSGRVWHRSEQGIAVGVQGRWGCFLKRGRIVWRS
jgi:hypothetical protein